MVSMYIKSGQTSGFGQLVVFLYDGPRCTGKITDAIGRVQIETTDSWQTGGTSVVVKATTQSTSVHLNVEKPYVGGALEVAFDAVRVTLHADPIQPAGE